jgi:hypothetical protein
MRFISALSLVGGCVVRQFDTLDAAIDGLGKCLHGHGVHSSQGVVLDGCQLEAVLPELGKNLARVLEKLAAEEGVRYQPADEGLDIAVRHAERYCCSRSALSAAGVGDENSSEVITAKRLAFQKRQSKHGKFFGGQRTAGERRTTPVVYQRRLSLPLGV